MANEVGATLGELRGFLEAFARFNDKVNGGFTFTLDRLPQAESVDKALELFFRGEAMRIVTSPLEDWPRAVSSMLRLWLFQFQAGATPHMIDQSESFELSHESGRDRVLEWFMKRLGMLVQPRSVWKVEVKTRSFYECSWNDVAFESAEVSYLLHLSGFQTKAEPYATPSG